MDLLLSIAFFFLSLVKGSSQIYSYKFLLEGILIKRTFYPSFIFS